MVGRLNYLELIIIYQEQYTVTPVLRSPFLDNEKVVFKDR